MVATLRALHDGGVDFILVGGLAAVLHGAPVDTFDIDVVHSRDAANVARILPVLEDRTRSSGCNPNGVSSPMRPISPQRAT